jgi:hypothetical protein
LDEPSIQTIHNYGKGKVIWGGEVDKRINDLYPEYDLTAQILQLMGVKQDFTANSQLRYSHRTTGDADIYFVSNRTDQTVETNAAFRSIKGPPQLWDAITGHTVKLPVYTVEGQVTSVPLKLAAYQSYFVVFAKGSQLPSPAGKNFPSKAIVKSLSGPWQVSFDPKWGGPKNIRFNELTDWTLRPEEGIKYYSGAATYHKEFDLPKTITAQKIKELYLDLGVVNNMARVKLNGRDLGIVWTAPWRVNISTAALKIHNKLEIEVINLWPNRLIGDEKLPDDGIKGDVWPEWLVKGLPRTSKRFTFSTYKFYTKDSPLLKSGLVGPVTIQSGY